MIALFVGGAASGKSVVAEAFAATLPEPVTYVATWTRPAVPDPGMEARVAAHRARRPAGWALCESGPDLAAALRATTGTVLLDALGTWVAAVDDFRVDSAALCAALLERCGDTVVVSDEVGLGVHPSTAVGGAFRDALGRVNGAVAAVADDAWLVVAGRLVALTVPSWPLP